MHLLPVDILHHVAAQADDSMAIWDRVLQGGGTGLLGGALWVIRYLYTRIEKLQENHSLEIKQLNETHSKEKQELNDKILDLANRAVSAVTANTETNRNLVDYLQGDDDDDDKERRS